MPAHPDARDGELVRVAPFSALQAAEGMGGEVSAAANTILVAGDGSELGELVSCPGNSGGEIAGEPARLAGVASAAARMVGEDGFGRRPEPLAKLGIVGEWI